MGGEVDKGSVCDAAAAGSSLPRDIDDDWGWENDKIRVAFNRFGHLLATNRSAGTIKERMRGNGVR
ncbi:hypothetical protein BOTNAR_1000g00020 [Botryotinia narcissicola]|uniref:Uncharacterized protein n=1 Tax=Botryotinia narcissicola TaxID=278944 RepID=A0A4Z1H979_9HELO|nr:hypothetical protein BOTNAR_1000g00020 [Botryotinia narcissicola]